MRPRLLDLFCGAGGAAVGYHEAGFDVVGVDLVHQPRYPFEFHQADAMTWPLDGYDAIHASPPCQRYSHTAVLHDSNDHPDLLAPTITRSSLAGRPFVVENVQGAPYPDDLFRVMLCGSSFSLRVRRHRWFVSNVLMFGLPCSHRAQSGRLLGVYGASDGLHPDGFKHPGTRRGPRQATTVEARELMGMPWAVERHELVEAIPPAYTRFIGEQLLVHLQAAA